VGKTKLAQITGSEIFQEGPKPKNLQISRMKFKKKYFTRRKPKMTYIRGGKALLTLQNICVCDQASVGPKSETKHTVNHFLSQTIFY
jgi:chromosomal replication initiation ATPase DnaA